MSIQIEELSYIYNVDSSFETYALGNVSLRIEKGSICGIMGKTGCGKSTLIQLVAGLLRPSAGRILIDDEDINGEGYDRLMLRRKLGIVFQYPESQLFETTAYKDVAFGLKHSELSDEKKDNNIRWALSVTGFDFEEVKDKSPLGLSGGEKRRLAIAGVLAVKPDYLILDEPIAGLDPAARDRFLQLLKDLNDDGMTIIVVTHNADAVAECADHLVILNEGRVALDGTLREVFAEREKMKNCGVEVSRASRIADMLAESGVIKQQYTAGENAEKRECAITFEELMPQIIASLRKGDDK